MAINLDSHLGVHAQSVSIRAQRAGLLATNLANADTPGFKARDIAFETVFKDLQSKHTPASKMRGSHSRHLNANGTANSKTNEAELFYRVPTQESLDGNTVQTDIENGLFTENAIRYKASLHFLNGKFTSMIKALRGE